MPGQQAIKTALEGLGKKLYMSGNFPLDFSDQPVPNERKGFGIHHNNSDQVVAMMTCIASLSSLIFTIKDHQNEFVFAPFWFVKHQNQKADLT